MRILSRAVLPPCAQLPWKLHLAVEFERGAHLAQMRSHCSSSLFTTVLSTFKANGSCSESFYYFYCLVFGIPSLVMYLVPGTDRYAPKYRISELALPVVEINGTPPIHFSCLTAAFPLVINIMIHVNATSLAFRRCISFEKK